MKKYEQNPFTLSFGSEPEQYIARSNETRELIQKIESDPPMSHFFIISGVRGSGKTVLLTSIFNYFANQDDFVTVELNPEDDLRESLAAKLYSNCLIKRLFTEKSFSFSFSGVGFSISGKNPVLNIDDLLDKMFAELKKQNKKVMILIDEATNNQYLRQFALSSQILIRRNYDLFVVMTSLYENISSIENEKNLTFLIRSPRLILTNLNISAIAASYAEIFSLDQNEAMELAKLTKGYAFAYQLLGYLLFESKEHSLSASLLGQFDQYLEEWVYRKVWDMLSPVEQKILRCIQTDAPIAVADIMKRSNMKKESFSQYRDRLIKKGVLTATARGQLMFALPRFNSFIASRF